MTNTFALSGRPPTTTHTQGVALLTLGYGLLAPSGRIGTNNSC